MKLLLDTNVLLWAFGDPNRLSSSMRERLRSRRNTVVVSVVSSWEIEIKRALGKLTIPNDLDAQIEAAGFTELPIRLGHVHALRGLAPIHRDPFDRMLVAQARSEGLTLVTSDATIARYPVRTLAM